MRPKLGRPGRPETSLGRGSSGDGGGAGFLGESRKREDILERAKPMVQTRMAGKRVLALRGWRALGLVGLALLPFVGCQCSSRDGPRVIPDPRLAEICTWSGKTEGVVNGVCPRRENDWGWFLEAGFVDVQPGYSDVEACPVTDDSYLVDLPNPGWLLRLEKTLPLSVSEHTSDQFSTGIVATRLDGAAPCSVVLTWTLKQQKVVLPMGAIVRWAMNLTILDVETDSFRTGVLRDEQGAFLMGLAVGIRPEVWPKDMWPELNLSFDPTPVCQQPGHPGTLKLRVTLSDGKDACALDGGTGRCCAFSGTQYQVQVPDAWRRASGSHPDAAWILVARQGLLASAP